MSDTDASMEDKTPIKYLLIGDSSTNKIITEFLSGNTQPKTKNEINQIFNKLCKTPNKKLDERNKITSKNENYYFTFCHPDLIYLILVNNEYPERYVFELIQKINDEKIPTMVNDEKREFQIKYEDTKSFKIGDTSNFKEYTKGGIVTKVVKPKLK